MLVQHRNARSIAVWNCGAVTPSMSRLVTKYLIGSDVHLIGTTRPPETRTADLEVRLDRRREDDGSGEHTEEREAPRHYRPPRGTACAGGLVITRRTSDSNSLMGSIRRRTSPRAVTVRSASTGGRTTGRPVETSA